MFHANEDTKVPKLLNFESGPELRGSDGEMTILCIRTELLKLSSVSGQNTINCPLCSSNGAVSLASAQDRSMNDFYPAEAGSRLGGYYHISDIL